VEWALTLISNGTLMVAVACASKGKIVAIPHSFNHTTGKESLHQAGFNDTVSYKSDSMLHTF